MSIYCKENGDNFNLLCDLDLAYMMMNVIKEIDEINMDLEQSSQIDDHEFYMVNSKKWRPFRVMHEKRLVIIKELLKKDTEIQYLDQAGKANLLNSIKP